MPLLLLHSNGFILDEILLYGGIAYILIMFILSRIRYRQIKQAKLRRKQQRQATQTMSDPNLPPSPLPKEEGE